MNTWNKRRSWKQIILNATETQIVFWIYIGYFLIVEKFNFHGNLYVFLLTALMSSFFIVEYDVSSSWHSYSFCVFFVLMIVGTKMGRRPDWQVSTVPISDLRELTSYDCKLDEVSSQEKPTWTLVDECWRIASIQLHYFVCRQSRSAYTPDVVFCIYKQGKSLTCVLCKSCFIGGKKTYF